MRFNSPTQILEPKFNFRTKKMQMKVYLFILKLSILSAIFIIVTSMTKIAEIPSKIKKCAKDK